MNPRTWLVGAAILVGMALLMAVTVVASDGAAPPARLASTTWYVDDDACPGPGAGTAGELEVWKASSGGSNTTAACGGSGFAG